MKKGFRIIKFKKNKPIFELKDISKSFDGRPILKKISMLCIRLTDNIIAVSNFTKSLIPMNLQLKTIVAQNGIDLNEWTSQLQFIC